MTYLYKTTELRAEYESYLRTERKQRRKGTGRPPRASEPANMRLSVRATRSEWRELKLRAAHAGLSMAEYMRRCALGTYDPT